jgi:hypothetical protein
MRVSGRFPHADVIIDNMVTFSGPPTAGTIVEPASLAQFELAAHGYAEEEFLVAGTAAGYDLAGAATADGRWTAVPAETAPFRTRIVVRRPVDAGRFSGTVLVEWLNVSSSFEADPDWAFLHQEIARAGHAYVAVSAQEVGVMGGTGRIDPNAPPAPGLRGSNPERYGTLTHPGDRYSFDLFRQIGGALKAASGEPAPLGGLRPAHVIAIGESQSAMYLTSYLNAVQPLCRQAPSGPPAFDGFLVHSRGAGGGPLTGAPIDPLSVSEGIRIRTDNDVPVLVLQTEGDLLPPLAFWMARQPDSDLVRVWEIAGTSHADSYLIGAAAPLFGLDWRINEGPHRYVAQAALRALADWVREGTPPPSASPIELTSLDPPVIARDEAGNAVGGVRTPVLDVPVVTLSGQPPAGSRHPVRWLFGSTTELPREYLVARYGDEAGYVRAFTESLDAAIQAGFLLPAHREELLAAAKAVTFPAAAPAADPAQGGPAEGGPGEGGPVEGEDD